MARAADEKVVAHRQHDAHVGLGGQLLEKSRELSLHLGRVQGEQLLELVEHHDGLAVP